MDVFNQIWNEIYCIICSKMRLITSPQDDFEVSPKRKNCIVNGILTPFDNNQESISSIKACTISQFQNKCNLLLLKIKKWLYSTRYGMLSLYS
jgi:hypothetical protein